MNENIRRLVGLVDELGQLEERMAATQPDQARIKAIKADIQAAYERQDAAEEYFIEGRRFVARVGPKAKETSIEDMPGLFRRLGREVFLRACRFPMEALKSLLPEHDVAAVTVSARTGSRRIEVTRKPAAEKIRLAA